MKVKELIALLEGFDGETEILVETEDDTVSCASFLSSVNRSYAYLGDETTRFKCAVITLDHGKGDIWYEWIGDDEEYEG